VSGEPFFFFFFFTAPHMVDQTWPLEFTHRPLPG